MVACRRPGVAEAPGLPHTQVMRLPTPMILQVSALMGAALVCAVVSNRFAGPQRKLAWWGVPMAPAVALPTAEPLAATVPSPGLPATPPAKSTERTVASPSPKPPPIIPATFVLRPGQPVRVIGSEEAAEARKAGIPFLDSRRSAEYELGHIAGAWSLPVWENTLEDRLTEFEAKANPLPEAPLVLYCSGGGCEDSHLLASRLFKLGYRNLLIYLDGYPDWVAKGRPTAKGATR